MELMKFTGTNTVEHWVNPAKIVRVTYTPPMPMATSPVEGPDTIGDDPVPVVMSDSTLIIHLDNGFAIQVADELQDLVDKLDKVG